MAIDPVFIAIWLVIGAVAGWLASLIVKAGSFGLIGDAIVGLVGAAIAGYCSREWASISAPASSQRSSTLSLGR